MHLQREVAPLNWNPIVKGSVVLPLLVAGGVIVLTSVFTQVIPFATPVAS